MPKNSRKLANLLIAPNRQLRLTLTAILVGLLFFFAIFGAQFWMSSALIESLSAFLPPDSGLNQTVATSVRWTWIVFFVASICFTTAITAITVVFSHRVYGPVYAIRKHLAALARGEYEYRTHLRKHDEFKDLAQDLNTLSELLQARGSRTS